MPDPIAQAFVADLMERAGLNASRDLAKALDQAFGDEERKVGRWVNGSNAPNFHATIQLLALSGWLNREGLEAYRAATRRAATKKEAEEALRRVETAVRHRGGRVGPPDS